MQCNILRSLHKTYSPITKYFYLFSVTFNCSHASEVVETDAWNSMVKHQSHLLADAFKALANQIPPLGPSRKRIKLS